MKRLSTVFTAALVLVVVPFLGLSYAVRSMRRPKKEQA